VIQTGSATAAPRSPHRTNFPGARTIFREQSKLRAKKSQQCCAWRNKMIASPKPDHGTSENSAEQLCMAIEREIEAIEPKQLRCTNPSSIEVFDFDRKWDLVLPHLHDDKVERVLADSMNQCERPIAAVGTLNRLRRRKRQCCRDSFDPTQGPWCCSTSNYWPDEILRRANEATPRFVWTETDDVPSEEETEEFNKFQAQFAPKPDTVEWYLAVRLCHWLARG
jgi:hypothetical protein